MSISEQSVGRPANIRDVARIAGVSHQTVSRVINKHPSLRAETRDRVLAVMDEPRRGHLEPGAYLAGFSGPEGAPESFRDRVLHRPRGERWISTLNAPFLWRRAHG